MIQQIPLSSGLITQVDAEEVGINGCTELINAEFDKPGLIYKRKGSGATLTSATIGVPVNIIRWYNPNIDGSNYYWILTDDQDKVFHSTDLVSWTEITFGISSSSDEVKIANYNTQLRFPCGLTEDARIYQYIDRDFFWSSEEGTPGFYKDIARPVTFDQSKVSSSVSHSSSIGSVADSSQMHDLTSKNLYYRCSYVYDGNQESPLETRLGDTTGIGGGSDKVPTITATFDVGATLGNWNRRITGINIYRSLAIDGAFYKIGSVSTLNDAHLKLNTESASRRNKCFIDDANANNISYLSRFISNSNEIQKYKTVESTTDSVLDFGDTSFFSDTPTTQENTWASEYYGDKNPGEVTNAFLIAPSQGMVLFPSNDNPGGVDTFTPTAVQGGVDSAVGSTDGGVGGGAYLYATGTAGNVYEFNETAGTYVASNTYTICGWISKGTATSCNLNITDGTSTNLLSKSLITGGNFAGSNKISNGSNDWYYFQYDFTTQSNTSITHTVNGNCTGTSTAIRMSRWMVIKKDTNLSVGAKAYFGTDTIVAPNLDLIADQVKGESYAFGVERGGVLTNVRNAIRVKIASGVPTNYHASTGASARNISLKIAENYSWKETSSGIQQLTFNDKNLIDGVSHPTFETSLDVKYKHAKFINGRNYVADVRITDSGTSEDHENWIMFSELNRPDVIPITNYIQLTDLQGGKIVGIESLLGDLVVFMERGIYRLSIPSADPTEWSLSEAEENFGCLSEHSITNYESGMFFASSDHIYHLDANFNLTPVTKSIKNDYQSMVDSNIRTSCDIKKGRLLCRFGSDGSTIYSMDLTSYPEERWTKVEPTDYDMDIFFKDENLNLYSYDTSTKKVAQHNDLKVEPTSFKRTTGWISNTDLDRSGVLRRLNLKYKSSDNITAKIYIDGDDSTVVKTITIPTDVSGADWYKCKPNVRCRSYKIELSTPPSAGDVEIRRLEVEFE